VTAVTKPASVLVVGAGVCGLAAATRLSASGFRVTVVDKSRGVGGRMATRRIGAARVDHGAQFFTVRNQELGALVEEWLSRGVAREWCRGFRRPPDGHPRYVGAAGMTDLAKDLAASLDVTLSTRIDQISPSAGGAWVARSDRGAPINADAVVLTPPVPQSLTLLGALADPEADMALRAISYTPTLSLLAVLDEDPGIPPPGALQLTDGPLSWVADNRAKGVSPVPALTAHASAQASAEWWELDFETATSALLDAARPFVGTRGPRATQLVRWRYAAPDVSHPDRCLVAVDTDRPVVCAGDAFGEPRVEGAFLSGLAAADAVTERLAASPQPGAS